MMLNIFSSMDPSFSKPVLFPISMILALNFLLLLTYSVSVWSSLENKMMPHMKSMEIMLLQLWQTKTYFIKGMSMILTMLFVALIMLNLMGLIPYTFSSSSHLIMTLTYGLPLWMAMILSSMCISPKMTIAHLLPDGAPSWLNPFLVLIETTSIMVRPLTLSFRLAANMTAGHVVMILLGSFSSILLLNKKSNILLSLPTTTGYIMFEVAICFIQAYIMCLLLSMYSNDHA